VLVSVILLVLGRETRSITSGITITSTRGKEERGLEVFSNATHEPPA